MYISDEIVKFLKSRPSDTFKISEIAKNINRKRSSVGVKLTYLVKANKVHRVDWGLYQHPQGLIRQEYDPYIRFHGIKFEHIVKLGGHGAYQNLQRIVTEQLRTPWIRKHPNNHSIVTSSDWEGRTLTVTLHREEVGLLEIWNKSSYLPLHPLEYGNYCGYLQGVFKIPSEFWTLRQLGINIDRKNVQLDGWSNISMKDSQNNVIRMYQKAKDLRVETHIQTKVSAKDSMKYLEGILQYAEILNKKNR